MVYISVPIAVAFFKIWAAIIFLVIRTYAVVHSYRSEYKTVASSILCIERAFQTYILHCFLFNWLIIEAYGINKIPRAIYALRQIIFNSFPCRIAADIYF